MALVDQFWLRPFWEWENTRIPETLIEFFSALLNISKVDLIRPYGSDVDSQDSDDEYEEENSGESEITKELPKVVKKVSAKPKVLLAQSLFQTLYYSVHSGKKKAPLQVMLAHSVYDKCKSKELMTSLNRLGSCISNSEYRRCKDRLEGNVYKKGLNQQVPLPSHINNDDFTIVAVDNFDHVDRSSMSGTKANHDTVTVILQNSNTDNVPIRKEMVSEFGPLPTGRKSIEKLECQKLQDYNFNKSYSKKMCIPSDFVTVSNPPYEDNQRSCIISSALNVNPPLNFLDEHQIKYPSQN